MSLALRLVALSFALPLFACGGGESACESAGRALCDQACACATDGACRFVSGGASITFDNQADCEALYVTLGCMGGGNTAIDFGACEADVMAAACIESGTPGELGVEMPASCDAN